MKKSSDKCYKDLHKTPKLGFYLYILLVLFFLFIAKAKKICVIEKKV